MRALILVLVIWVCAGFFVDLHEYFLPEPAGFFESLFAEFMSGGLLKHISITFLRVFGGVFLAIIIGIPLGLLMGQHSGIRKHSLPVLEFLRGIPTSMLFPLFIVAFGFGELSKVLICLYLAVPIVVINTMLGSIPRATLQARYDYIKVHENRIPVHLKIFAILWDALPSVISGIKVAISLSLVIIIVTEMFFVASSGIGWASYRAYEAFQIDKMYVYIIVAGMAGLFLNKLFDLAMTKVSDLKH